MEIKMFYGAPPRTHCIHEHLSGGWAGFLESIVRGKGWSEKYCLSPP